MRPSHPIIHRCIQRASASAYHTKYHQLLLLSANHCNLSTTIRHANSSPPSTVHIGTTYETLCLHTLPLLGFQNLTRVGGRSDRGIDLLGHWVLPHEPSVDENQHTLRVIIQCKSHTRPPLPSTIRELEGAVAGAPGEWNGVDTIGVLCARNEATEGVRAAVRRSRRGVVWIMIADEGGGRVKQMLWNERVTGMVGRKVGSGLKYVTGKGGTMVDKEVRLTVDGRVWVPEEGN